MSAPLFTGMAASQLYAMGAVRWNRAKQAAETAAGRAPEFLEQLIYDSRAGTHTWYRVPVFTGDLITPTIIALAPAGAVVGSPDIILEVWGERFIETSQIIFAGKPMPTTYLSNQTLTTPLHPAGATAGTFPVTVTSMGYTAPPVDFIYHPAGTAQTQAPPLPVLPSRRDGDPTIQRQEEPSQ